MAYNLGSQEAIARRILFGNARRGDVATAKANFERWPRKEWDGDFDRAVGDCMGSLSLACGVELLQAPQHQQLAHFWFFTFLCPPRMYLDSAAQAYRGWVSTIGGFHKVAVSIQELRRQNPTLC